jgi:LacI family transcriptional regulator
VLDRTTMTLEDVAREAGVSLATVDRVLNNRHGVKAATAERVFAAMRKLDYRPDPLAARLARRQSAKFCFLIPFGNNAFIDDLEVEVRRSATWLSHDRVSVEIIKTHVHDPDSLAATLLSLKSGYAGVGVVALDHPRVRAAIDELAEAGIPVLTLVSDVQDSRRLAYVGVDNTAAGRTVGRLMGGLLGGREGKVGLLVASFSLRDHLDRQLGFAQVIERDFPSITVLSPVHGRDDVAAASVKRLLAEHEDLIGIYSTGAGVRGMASALHESGRKDIVVIAHELTEASREFLLDGTIAALIVQDPGHEARAAARILLAQLTGQHNAPESDRIRIEIYVKDNLPSS